MSQTALSNALIRHQIFLQRYAGGVNNSAQDELLRVMNTIIYRIENSDLNQMQAAYLYQLFEEVADIAYSGSADLLEPEAEFTANVLTKNGAPVVATSVDRLLQIYTTTESELLQGKTKVKLTPFDMVETYTRGQTTQVLQIIRDGMITGETNKEIAKKVRQHYNTRTKQQTEALVRTMVNQSANVARNDTYSAAGIEYEEFTAVLDRRTTLICGTNDGKVFKVGTGPIPPLHYGCRSSRIPVFDKEKGAQVGEYEKWLKRQPKRVQEEILGKERTELFRSGELTLDQFVDKSGITYSLDQLQQLYDIEIE